MDEKDPIDSYSKLQPLVKLDIDNAIQQYASDRKYDVAQIPAHTHTGVDSNKVDFENIDNRSRYILYRILDPAASTFTTTTLGGNFVMPFAGHVTDVGATVDTAGTTGVTTIDINKTNITTLVTSSIISTKITIDSTETSSRTAATPYVFDSSVLTFSKGDYFTFDVDTISTTAAKGLTIFMTVIETK